MNIAVGPQNANRLVNWEALDGKKEEINIADAWDRIFDFIIRRFEQPIF